MQATHSIRPRLAFTLVMAMSIACSLCLTAGLRADQEPSQADVVSDQAFLAWVKDTAIHLDDWKLNSELEAYLDQVTQGKRIIYIGEPGHFFHEKYEVQLMLIRHLAKKGYRHICIEGLGASRAPVWDTYVREGKNAFDDELSEEIESKVQNFKKQVTNVMVGANAADFKQRQAGEERRFYDALHEVSRSLDDPDQPLRILPFDIDTMSSGGCYFSIANLLEPFGEDPAFEAVRGLAMKLEGETPDDEIERLEELREYVVQDPDGVLDAMTAQERSALDRHTDCLLETKAFYHTSRADGNLVRALERREPAMFRQVNHALDALPPDAKVIMLGHQNHLSKVGADISRARRPSMGEMIDDLYPGAVFSIWMLHDHGWLLNPMNPEPLEELRSSPQRIESVMVEAGSTYLLPLGTDRRGEKYLDQKRSYSYFSWSETSTLTTQTDALIFIDEITPLQK